MRSKKTVVIVLLIAAALAAIALLRLEFGTHAIARWYDRWILGGRNHYLTCPQLPSLAEVDRVVQAHRDDVEQIITRVGQKYRNAEVVPLWKGRSVTDGERSYVTFSWGEPFPACQNTGRGDIEIDYPARKDRVMIEQIIGSDTFFGIPYRLKNI